MRLNEHLPTMRVPGLASHCITPDRASSEDANARFARIQTLSTRKQQNAQTDSRINHEDPPNLRQTLSGPSGS